MDNFVTLTPGQHRELRDELIRRTARRLVPHMQESSRREARADAENSARIEAGRIVDDLLDQLARLSSGPRRSLADLIAAVK